MLTALLAYVILFAENESREGVTREMTVKEEEMLSTRDQIVKILEENNCTVREAQHILSDASRMILALSHVQLESGHLYSF